MHVAKRDLGLDDDDYRAVISRVTGKTSAKLMSIPEQQRCLAEFRRLGFESGQPRLEGPYVKKLQALWLSAYNLGIARSRTDAALIAFAHRQTGIDHVRWVRNGHDAARVIEGLKGWMAREAGVVWPAGDNIRAVKLAIIAAQSRKLELPQPENHEAIWPKPADLDMAIKAYGRRIRATV
jgi:hypothetical protein